MFEVNGVYANRIGKYTVLAINGPKMTVRYEDGSEADLRISVQERIWENIEAEFRASELKNTKSKKKKRAPVGLDNSFYIKVVSVIEGNDLSYAGWSEKVVMESLKKEDPKMKAGDRLLFYVREVKTFVAVATITGKAKRANPSNYFYKVDAKKMDFFPIDIDASVTHLDTGYTIDSIDLESQPNLKNFTLDEESLLEINEDDFELVAEMITEVVEEIEEDSEEVADYSEEDED
ncbi:MAG: EVE domain-containing protein [Chloroflexota bacterium]